MKPSTLMTMLVGFLLFKACSFSAITLDFEDLSHGEEISGTNYAGLTWEFGNTTFEGNQGLWVSPRVPNNPYSGTRNIINGWGCALIGIEFPVPVKVLGAYIAAQGNSYFATTGVRVHGYLDGIETTVTDWFADIDDQPDWFQIDLQNVDRIVFESIPAGAGTGSFGMDDLTYEIIPEPTTLLLFCLGGLVLRRRHK